MRRPLTALAFSLSAGIATAYYTDLRIWHLCILCMGACFVCALARQRIGALAEEEGQRQVLLSMLCLGAFVFGAARMVHAEAAQSAILCRAQAEQLSVVCVEGFVSTVSYKNDRWDLTVKTESETVLVRLDTGEEDRMAVADLAGRICRFTGTVRAPDGRRNFGCFDYALYLKGRGIRCLCNVSRYRVEVGEIRSSFLHVLSISKARFLDRISPLMPRDAFSLLAGLMFGEKGYLDEDIYASFQENGIAHVLAVSGLHVGLVYALVQKILAGRRNASSSLLCLGALLCYACLSNFSVSVLRAFFMISLHMAAFHLRRRYDLVSAASLAVLVFLSANPHQLFDSGFQLSYMAAYSLGVALPMMQLKALEWADRYKKAWIDDAAKTLLPCFAVQLGMTPLTLFHFLMLSPVSLLINPVAVALAGLLLPAGLALFFVQMLNLPLLTAAAAAPAAALAKMLLMLDDAAGRIGWSSPMAAPTVGMLFLYYGLFFYLFSEGRAVLLRKGCYRGSAVLCICLLLASTLVPPLFGIGNLLPWLRLQRDVVFVDVGQGDCIHVSCDGFHALIDGGGSFRKNVGEDTLQPYLLKNGITGLELAIVTHPDQDHAKGLKELSQVMPIRTIVFPSVYRNDITVTDGYRAERFVFLGRGDEIRLGDAIFHVLTPYQDGRVSGQENDANETCLTAVLQIGDCKFLLAADMTDSIERQLLADGTPIDADILKVAHHGSAYSSREDFVSAVNLRCAVISCGRNNSYGHPAERVTAMLQEMDAVLLRTDSMGAIGLTIRRDGSVRIENADGTVKGVLTVE